MAIVVDPIEYNRLRRDVGTSESVLSDEVAQEYLDEASEKYPNDTAKTLAYARVIVIRGIRSSAALLGRYAQNQSEEDLTKVFGNLGELLKEAIAEVDRVADPVENVAAPLFFGVASGRRGA